MNRSIIQIEFIKKIIQGDLKAFKWLYDKYFDKTYQAAMVLLKDSNWAEDVVQEVFVRVWQNRHKLDPESEIWYYLFVLTKNTSISKLREIQKEKVFKENLYHSIQQKVTFQENLFHEKQLSQKLSNAKSQLTPQQRVVFEMCREEGLSYTQVAQKLHISKNTVKNHMSDSIKILKNLLKKDIIYLILYLLKEF